jgi:hypothetical protein
VAFAIDPAANEASVGIVLTKAARRYEVVCDWQEDIQVNTFRPDRYAPDCVNDLNTGTLFTANGFSYGSWVVDPHNMERYNAVYVYLPEYRTYVTVLLSDLPGGGGVAIYAPKGYHRWQHHHSLEPQALKIYSSFHSRRHEILLRN